MHYLNDDMNNFLEYTNKKEEINEIIRLSDFEQKGKLTDEEVLEIIKIKYNFKNDSEMIKFFKDRANRKEILGLKEISGANKLQISRIIRISRGTINKIWENDKKDPVPIDK